MLGNPSGEKQPLRSSIRCLAVVSISESFLPHALSTVAKFFVTSLVTPESQNHSPLISCCSKVFFFFIFYEAGMPMLCFVGIQDKNIYYSDFSLWLEIVLVSFTYANFRCFKFKCLEIEPAPCPLSVMLSGHSWMWMALEDFYPSSLLWCPLYLDSFCS